jgi:hypothetical protein
MVGFCGEAVGIGYFCGPGSHSFVFVAKYRNKDIYATAITQATASLL